MEQSFQTSFIPKKPLAPERVVHSHPINMLTVVSVFVFFSVVLTAGGLYFYKATLTKRIDQMNKDLIIAKNRFEPAKINQLKELDKRLSSATSILAGHVAISPIFDLLEKVTLKTVRYTKFSYAFSTETNSRIDVQMSGQAVGYRSIALQSDLFSEHKKEIIDPVFSNLSLDNKGNVIFDLNFSVDPSFINYEQLILTSATSALVNSPAPANISTAPATNDGTNNVPNNTTSNQ